MQFESCLDASDTDPPSMATDKHGQRTV
ncbi:MAG: hypothetical protein ACJA09_003664, partial [Alcanivorax sp.]